jgi:hypothetical protein
LGPKDFFKRGKRVGMLTESLQPLAALDPKRHRRSQANRRTVKKITAYFISSGAHLRYTDIYAYITTLPQTTENPGWIKGKTQSARQVTPCTQRKVRESSAGCARLNLHETLDNFVGRAITTGSDY